MEGDADEDGRGLIYAKTPKAAFNIENLLHNQKVADLFPGH